MTHPVETIYCPDLAALLASATEYAAAGAQLYATNNASGGMYQPAIIAYSPAAAAILRLHAMAAGTHHVRRTSAFNAAEAIIAQACAAVDAAAELIREAQNCGEVAEIETARQHFSEALAQNTNDDTAEDDSAGNSFSRIACAYLARAAAQHPEAAPLGYLPIHTIDGTAYALTDMLGGMAYQPGPECLMTEARAAAMRPHLLKIAQASAARNFEDGFTLREWRPATAERA